MNGRVIRATYLSLFFYKKNNVDLAHYLFEKTACGWHSFRTYNDMTRIGYGELD